MLHLKMPIKGWFTDDDGKVYQRLVSDIVGGNILEIGNHHGLSLSYIFNLCRSRRNTIYCVDAKEYKELKDNLDRWKNTGTAVVITARSQDVVFPPNFFDLVFLDGSHKYEDVKNDILHFTPCLKPNGTMAGHNYEMLRVQRAVADLIGNVEVDAGIWIWRRGIDATRTICSF
jgi:predicted O-methyltransferase YrrM